MNIISHFVNATSLIQLTWNVLRCNHYNWNLGSGFVILAGIRKDEHNKSPPKNQKLELLSGCSACRNMWATVAVLANKQCISCMTKRLNRHHNRYNQNLVESLAIFFHLQLQSTFRMYFTLKKKMWQQKHFQDLLNLCYVHVKSIISAKGAQSLRWRLTQCSRREQFEKSVHRQNRRKTHWITMS